MKSKSKLKYIRTTGRQIKNCTANKAISTTDAVRRIDRQTDRQIDRELSGQRDKPRQTNGRPIYFLLHILF